MENGQDIRLSWIEPQLLIKTEDGKIQSSVPLSRCNPEQTEDLYYQLQEKLSQANSVGNISISQQIQFFMNSVRDRMSLFEQGILEKPKPKPKTFSNIRILDDEDDEDYD